MFITRIGCAEVRSCQKHNENANCYKCFKCDTWFCESCDLVHTCHKCGGTYCFHCKPCQFCQSNALLPHPQAKHCECGSYLNLTTPGCEECHRLDCLANCELRILTNSCCRRDKCGQCSVWHTITPEFQIRKCATCPLPSNAVLKACTHSPGFARSGLGTSQPHLTSYDKRN